MNDVQKSLLASAQKAAQRAYADYSRFHVGAAVLAGGKVFVGANIENASANLGLCAERVAIAHARMRSKASIEGLAIFCADAKRIGNGVAAVEVSTDTVGRVRQRFVEHGLDAALVRKKQDQPSRERVLDGAAEARLIAIACSEPPDERKGWTLSMLADKLVELEVVESVSTETVRRALKKTSSSRT